MSIELDSSLTALAWTVGKHSEPSTSSIRIQSKWKCRGDSSAVLGISVSLQPVQSSFITFLYKLYLHCKPYDGLVKWHIFLIFKTFLLIFFRERKREGWRNRNNYLLPPVRLPTGDRILNLCMSLTGNLTRDLLAYESLFNHLFTLAGIFFFSF